MFHWIQAGVTPLDPDEAYYVLYAQRLDWGYFDHPPMTALLIKAGMAVFPGEFGVRFFFPVLQTLSFAWLWQLAGPPKGPIQLRLFVLLTAAMPFFHVFGFVAAPDSPLLFFAAFYFWSLKGLYERDSWFFSILLALAMAGMLYSKYHGVLLIFFSLLPIWRNCFNIKWITAGLLGLISYLPHLNWQYQHDFVSLRYHLLGGRDDVYELKYTLTYLFNQAVVFSPLLFPFLIRALTGVKNEPAIRLYKWVILGFWFFFLYSTTKGHVEPQWTAILAIPVVLLLFQWSVENPSRMHRVQQMAIATLVVILAVRIIFMLPVEGIKNPFRKWGWIEPLREITGNTPLVFQNSYRNAAQYIWQTGEKAYTFTDIFYRPSQFDLWDDEKNLQNKTVWIIGQGDWKKRGTKELKVPLNTFRIRKVDSLQVARKVRLDFTLPPGNFHPGDTLRLPVRLYNPYPHVIYPEKGDMPLSFWAIYDLPRDHAHVARVKPDPVLTEWPPGDTVSAHIILVLPRSLKGRYDLSLGIATGDLPPGYNSSRNKIVIAD